MICRVKNCLCKAVEDDKYCTEHYEELIILRTKMDEARYFYHKAFDQYNKFVDTIRNSYF